MSSSCPRCGAAIAAQASFCGSCGAAQAPSTPATAPLVGRVLNSRYRLEQALGEGGFGTVYRGLQLKTGRPVAIKVLHPQMTSDASFVARFEQEAQLACSLRDPHTVITHDFDKTEDEIVYLVMELLEGASLQAELATGQPMPADRAARILDQICASLAEAHDRGIVHRDIKPENVVVEQRAGAADQVKVLDFGIAKIMTGGQHGAVAKLTAAGMTVGTLEYMSPEQLQAGELDGRSDIYALGVLLYQMLTGRLPFTGAPASLILDQLEKQPAPPSALNPALPPGLDHVVLRCLAKDRALRFADVVALRQALLSYTQPAAPGSPSSPVAAPPPGPPPVTAAPPGPPPSPQLSPAPGPAGVAPTATPPAPRYQPSPSGSRAATAWIVVGTIVALGLAALGVGIAIALSDDEGPQTATDRAGLQRENKQREDKQGSGKRADRRQPATGETIDPRHGLLRLASPRADLVIHLSPRRLFAVPGFRAGWLAQLPAAARLTLARSGTRPERIEALVLVAPTVSPPAWEGSGRDVPSAVAVDGVDPQRVLGLLANSGWRESREGLWRQGPHAAAKVSQRALVAGQLAPVKQALAARQLAPSDASEAAALARLLERVGGKAPLLAGQLRLPPSKRAELARELGVQAPALRALVGGAERKGGSWTLRVGLRTTSGAAASARGALEALRGRALRHRHVARTPLLRKVVASATISASGELALLTLRLAEAELEQLVLTLSGQGRGTGGGQGPGSGELPSY